MTLTRLKNIFLGGCTLVAPRAFSSEIVDLCMKNHLNYNKMHFNADEIVIDIQKSKGGRLSSLLSKCNIPHKFTEYGIPSFLSKYKSRFGLFGGAIIIAAMLILSEKYVWDIRISGNSNLSSAEIKEQLSSVGFSVGSRIGERDVDEITNELLLSSKSISWASINFHGNVAYVNVREKILPENEKESIYTPSNVVATRDGIIEYYQVLRGKETVTAGQSVREGELLISGVIENSHGETRYEHAMGKVYAITNHSFSVEIPLEYEKKVMSEPVCTQKTVKIFSKYINIFKKGGNLGSTCVKIIREEPLSFFSLGALPVSILSEITSEYTAVTARRSEADASSLAFFELENLIISELSDAQLLQKNITTDILEDKFLLTCNIVCLENIARASPIEKTID